MDKNLLISKLSKAIPGAVLETRRFGRSAIASAWVEAKAIQKVAAYLKNDSEYKLDWLENLSVVELENVFVATYFIRSTATKHGFIVRVSVVPPSPQEEASLPSIRSVWPMGEPMENEIEEMFGIFFEGRGSGDSTKFRRLPEGWKGYPLRKNYSFPKDFFGVPHSRPSHRFNPKKQSS